MRAMIKILRGALTAILCVVLLVNVWLLFQQAVLKKEAPQVLGYSHYIVTSGSMEPEFSAGDLVLVKSEDSYQLGDIVTFTDSVGAVVTHRITGRVDGQFITKGDANNTEDGELLAPENIIGRLQCVLPGVGSVVLFLRSPLGLLILIVFGVLLIKLPDWAGVLKTKARGRHAE